eukprot:12601232-Alexandrium_andersonii.AAC.1
MSASLVGSEMCIRDRPKPAAMMARPHLRRGRTGDRDERGGSRWGRPVPWSRLARSRRCWSTCSPSGT